MVPREINFIHSMNKSKEWNYSSNIWAYIQWDNIDPLYWSNKTHLSKTEVIRSSVVKSGDGETGWNEDLGDGSAYETPPAQLVPRYVRIRPRCRSWTRPRPACRNPVTVGSNCRPPRGSPIAVGSNGGSSSGATRWSNVKYVLYLFNCSP